MPTAQAAAPHNTNQPDTTTPEPSRICRVIHFVRRLIGYGTMLADAVQAHPTEPLALLIVAWFDTTDLTLILRRLTRGLMRAAALEAWLVQRAARGDELRTPPPRLSRLHPRRTDPPPHEPAEDAGLPAAAQDPEENDPDRLPTMAELDAEVRCRPIGAVVADICEDLGVLYSTMDQRTWREMSECIVRNGGNFAGLLIRNNRRTLRNPMRRTEPCTVPPPPPPPPALG